MTNFTERGKSFEAEYSRNQELAFRITARRNRLFGLWAAAKIGLADGEERDSYAKAVIAADLPKRPATMTSLPRFETISLPRVSPSPRPNCERSWRALPARPDGRCRRKTQPRTGRRDERQRSVSGFSASW